MEVGKQRHSTSLLIKGNDKKIGYFYALIHLIKGVIGVGLFALGYAIKNGGLFVGPPLVLLMGIITVHCQHLLVKCAESVTEYTNENDDDPLDYAGAVELCFKNGPPKVALWSKAVSVCINVCICLTQFGFCCVYLVFISTNIQQVLASNGIDFNSRYLLLIVWFPIWLSCLITNLKTLAPVSMAANVLLTGSFIATITAAYMGELKDISELRAYATPWQYALFFGTVIFAFETIALVLPIKNAMKNPENYAPTFGVLNVGMSIVLLMYLISGITGYLRWGEEVAGSLTLNLDDTLFSQCIKIAVSLGIMFTYPLHFYVPIQVLVPWFLEKTHLTNMALLGEIIFRSLMTICTLIIAQLVPHVGLFISLIGALCSTAIALVFPPITELLLLEKSQPSRFFTGLIIFKNTLILILAVASFTIGSTISTIEIVEHFKKSLEEGYFSGNDY